MENENDVLYIVVPAYNEQDNIGNLINDWYPVVEKHNGAGKSRLVIVNDGSKDNTSAIPMGRRIRMNSTPFGTPE